MKEQFCFERKVEMISPQGPTVVNPDYVADSYPEQ